MDWLALFDEQYATLHLQRINAMRKERAKQAPPTGIFIEKAMALSNREAARLKLRMRRKFERRKEDIARGAIETLALQLAFEETELSEWRLNVAKIMRQQSICSDRMGLR